MLPDGLNPSEIPNTTVATPDVNATQNRMMAIKPISKFFMSFVFRLILITDKELKKQKRSKDLPCSFPF